MKTQHRDVCEMSHQGTGCCSLLQQGEPGVGPTRKEELFCFRGIKIHCITIVLPIYAFFKRSAASCCGSSTTMYTLVSSAKSHIAELKLVTISFMKTRNNRGPGMEPCGTPAEIDT